MLHACDERFDVIENLKNFLFFWVSSKKIYKIFQIPHHIESLDVYMEY